MSDRYPLDIENVGEDTYMLMSRGHHDVHEFMQAVRAAGYEWSLGMPEHQWCKTVPTKKAGYNCWYAIVPEGTRGAYPITIAHEDYGDTTYEALAARRI